MPTDTRNNFLFRKRLALFRAVARLVFCQTGFHVAAKADPADAVGPGSVPYSHRFAHKDADIKEKTPRISPLKRYFHHAAHRPDIPVSHRYGDGIHRHCGDKAVLLDVVIACPLPTRQEARRPDSSRYLAEAQRLEKCGQRLPQASIAAWGEQMPHWRRTYPCAHDRHPLLLGRLDMRRINTLSSCFFWKKRLYEKTRPYPSGLCAHARFPRRARPVVHRFVFARAAAVNERAQHLQFDCAA